MRRRPAACSSQPRSTVVTKTGTPGTTPRRIRYPRCDSAISMKLVIAATGASGAIYLQRLLAQIDCAANEVHLVMSAAANEVAKQELDDFQVPSNISRHSENDMNVPFVSGSSRFDAMVIVPCSMATLGRIA